ncbi:Low-density lipoprotein receptor-related protein 2 [Halotydeus destructor]|nr:Low-density lipoprotein receptor-related protein 2 [Halotydeus destructor]
MRIPLHVILLLTLKSTAWASNCHQGWLDCGNDVCVARLWQCDGEDDCGNGHDELDSLCLSSGGGKVVMPTIKCPQNHFACNGTQMCLPDRWRCDGNPDCPTGEDEANCSTSACVGFTCKSLECIPTKWHCDGVADCHDHSDEANCPKGSHPGPACSVSGSLFECQSGECIQNVKVCDGHPDCANGEDEGPHCLQEKQCSNHRCNHGCFVTPLGEQCFCNPGYELALDGMTCKDINECEVAGYCSQGCMNTPGAAVCSCHEGYKLVNGTHCQAEGPSPMLLFSDGLRIRGFFLRTGQYFPVVNAIKQVIGIDMHGPQKRVFWADHGESTAGVYSCYLEGNAGCSTSSPVVSVGLKEPEDVAVDWVGLNLYITDMRLSQIIVCKLDGSICTSLFNDIKRPRSIALSPSNGYMYWTEWGDQVGVYQAGMDGSDRMAVARKDLKWPNGLTFDSVTQRLYWCDAQFNKIEYFDTVTKQRQVVLEGTVFHPFAMTVFEDKLYWSDWITYSLETCNKYTGRNQSILLRDANQLMGVHVYHPVLDSDNHNPCWSDQCSHVCLLGPRKTFKCACPAHLVIGKDGMTCESASSDFVLVATTVGVKKIYAQSVGHDVLADVLMPKNLKVGDYAFDDVNNILYVFDMNKYLITAVNTTSGVSRVIISSHIDTISGLTYCPMTRNLYWLEVNKGHLVAASLATERTVRLITTLERPIDLVIHPIEKVIFIANLGSNPCILMADLDGRNQRKIVASHIGLPVALSLCTGNNILYWADAKLGTIDSVALHEDISVNRRREVRNNLGHVMSVAVHDDTVFWTDMDHGFLYQANVHEKEERAAHVPLPGNHSLSHAKKVKVFSSHDLVNVSSPCSKANGGCDHVCLTGSNGAYCTCSSGYFLDEKDKKTCHEEKKACSDEEWRCHDGSDCLMKEWLCDGHFDCSDGSDETNCTGCDGFECGDGKCIIHDWKCDSMDDCSDSSDETNCTSAAECSSDEFSCGNGHCIALVRHCDNNPDCKNGQDEENCGDQITCEAAAHKFVCKNGNCVPTQWRCDGEDDCGDRSDEQDCESKACQELEFRCKNNVCIDQLLACDKSKDCSDGSDEEHCDYPPATCLPGQFTCEDDGHCIYPSDVCDGHDDCANGEDERANCSRHHKCHEHEAYCDPGANKSCVPIVWLCDGENDCGDWSDETRPQCQVKLDEMPTTTARPCWDDSFPCGTGECVPFELVCNDEHDCLDGSDEGSQCVSACDRAKKDGRGCEQECHDTPTGSRCSCRTGFTLAANGINCTDVDECTLEGYCSQICENTVGSYHCKCSKGWVLAGDKKRCKPDPVKSSSEAFLLYALPDKIRAIGLNTHVEHLIHQSREMDISGLDYDMKTGTVFWLEKRRGAIMSHSLAGSQGKINMEDKVVRKNINAPTHLSLDWLGRNFYFFSDGFIHVCNLNGTYCRQLFATGHLAINSLLVIPEEGLLFFSVATDPSSTVFGVIERANMDGQLRRRVISGDSRVFWPSSLTSDTIHRVIYWTDPRKECLGVSDYNGGKRKILLAYALSSPYALGVFEDNLFVSNFGTDTITKVNKFDGNSRRIFHRNGVKAEVMRVAHKVMQPDDTNACANATCHHLCLLSPGNQYKCSCDSGYTFNLQGRCIRDSDWTGDATEIDGNAETLIRCDDSLCENGGSCIIINEEKKCRCRPDYAGSYCEELSEGKLNAEERTIFGWVLLSVVFCILFILAAVVMSYIFQSPYSIDAGRFVDRKGQMVDATIRWTKRMLSMRGDEKRGLISDDDLNGDDVAAGKLDDYPNREGQSPLPRVVTSASLQDAGDGDLEPDYMSDKRPFFH